MKNTNRVPGRVIYYGHVIFCDFFFAMSETIQLKRMFEPLVVLFCGNNLTKVSSCFLHTKVYHDIEIMADFLCLNMTWRFVTENFGLNFSHFMMTL